MQKMADLNSIAKIGIEFEFFMPVNSKFWLSGEKDRDTQSILRFDTLSEFQEFFSISKYLLSQIQRDLRDWIDQKEEEFIDETWEEHYEISERQARKDAAELFPRDQYDWDIWFHEEFASAKKFIEHYELEPLYGWYDETYGLVYKEEEADASESGWLESVKQMVEELSLIVESQVNINAGNYDTWNVYHDASIKDNDGTSYAAGMKGYGVEIVSPPLAPLEALDTIKAIFTWANKSGLETNESTGIHVNISMKDMSTLDPVKLVLFAGDKHILKKFDRSTNVFAKSQYTAIIDNIAASGAIPKDAKKLIDLATDALTLSAPKKHSSINFSHINRAKGPYIEFRAAGGKDYHRRFNDIEEVVGRWLTALEIACNPQMNRNLYLKKIMKLFDIASAVK